MSSPRSNTPMEGIVTSLTLKRKAGDEPTTPQRPKKRRLADGHKPQDSLLYARSKAATEYYKKMIDSDRILEGLRQEREPGFMPHTPYTPPLFYGHMAKAIIDSAKEAQIFDPYCKEFLEAEWPEIEDALDIEIHPIFDISKWDTTLDYITEFHEKIEPALKLATHLLTERSLSGWWRHVHYSNTSVKDKEVNKQVLVSTSEDVDVDTGYAAVQSRLIELSEALRWYVRPAGTEEAVTDANPWLALKNMSKKCRGSEKVPEPENDAELDEISPVIGISSATIYQIISEHGSSKVSAGQNMRTQWRLAFTLVHEIAHSFYMFKMRDSDFAQFTKRTRVGGKKIRWDIYVHEPYMYVTDPIPEIGLSWEHSINGALMTCEPRLLNDIGPLMLRPWEYAYSQMRVGLLVPMSSVKAWFQKSTWDNFETNNPNIQLPSMYKRGETAAFVAERFGASPKYRAFHILYIDRKPAAMFDTIKESSARKDKNIKLEEVENPCDDECVRTWYENTIAHDKTLAKKAGINVARWLDPRGEYEQTCYDKKGPPQRWRRDSFSSSCMTCSF